MRICAAQLHPVAGNIEANLDKHIQLIQLAIQQNLDLVFFPELSLTGFEPSLAKHLASTVDDPRWQSLQSHSTHNNLIIGCGMPTITEDGIRISLMFFQPKLPSLVYSKQILHKDEYPFFVPGKQQVVLHSHEQVILPAICYESVQSEHAEQLTTLGANLYLASVAKDQTSVSHAQGYYANLAKQRNITVVMANAIGPADNFVCTGCSAAWNQQGDCVAQLGAATEGLVGLDTLTAEPILSIL